LRLELAGEKDLYLSSEMFAARGARRRLSVDPGATAKQTSGNDPSVIQDEQFIATEQVGKIGEEAIIENAFRAR
jgi:hypothetical protein